jgi:hypothetical protein
MARYCLLVLSHIDVLRFQGTGCRYFVVFGSALVVLDDSVDFKHAGLAMAIPNPALPGVDDCRPITLTCLFESPRAQDAWKPIREKLREHYTGYERIQPLAPG